MKNMLVTDWTYRVVAHKPNGMAEVTWYATRLEAVQYACEGYGKELFDRAAVYDDADGGIVMSIGRQPQEAAEAPTAEEKARAQKAAQWVRILEERFAARRSKDGGQ